MTTITTKWPSGIDTARSTSHLPRLALDDMAHRWFAAPAPLTPATERNTARRPLSAYNLADAPSTAFALFFRECLATVPGSKRSGLAESEADNADSMQRWWLLNEVMERGGRVVLWTRQSEAVAAVATLNGLDMGTKSEVQS